MVVCVCVCFYMWFLKLLELQNLFYNYLNILALLVSVNNKKAKMYENIYIYEHNHINTEVYMNSVSA